jgi:hypothetical protein
MAYYVGDKPADDIVFEPMRGQDAVNLSSFNTATVALLSPSGVAVANHGLTARIANGAVIVDWPTQSVFTVAGCYTIRVTLSHAANNLLERLAPIYVVIQADDGWLTVDTIRVTWIDADTITDHQLWQLLAIARDQILEYAPTLAEGAKIPLNYVRAQELQARNLFNAGKVDPSSGGMGEDTFIIRPFPLDWSIKQLLRPQKMPVVG